MIGPARDIGEDSFRLRRAGSMADAASISELRLPETSV